MVDFTPPTAPSSGLDFGGTPSNGGALDWFQGFGKSAIESIPELFGRNPSDATAEWRQDNPVGGVASQILGTSVPYLGWFKAAKAIKPLVEIASTLGKAKNPFIGGALETGATLLPLEASRVAVNQVAGDQSFGGMLSAAATDLALGSGVGGLLGGIGAAGTRDPKLSTIFPGLDMALPLPLMVRQMRNIIDSGSIKDAEALGTARAKLNDTLVQARIEELPPGQKYIGPIEGNGKSELESQLNRLFRSSANASGEDSIVQIKRFATGSRDFGPGTKWTEVAKEAALPEDFAEHGQYFRHINFQYGGPKDSTLAQSSKAAEKIANGINNTLTRNMDSVGGGNFITREADDGMFVIARKYQGEPNKGAVTDKWVLFKTDKPGYFLPDQERYANLQLKLAQWAPNAMPVPDAGPVYNVLQGYFKNFPLSDWASVARDSKVKDIIKALAPQSLAKGSNEVIARFGEAAREYLYPRIWQFRGSARANYVVNAAKLTADQAETTTNQLLYGKKTDAGLSMVLGAVKGELPEGLDGLVPAKKLFDDAGEKATLEWHQKIWKNNVPPDQLKQKMIAGDLSPEAMKLGQGLNAINDWRTTATQKVETAVGREPTEYPEGLYGLPRVWEGDTRIIIANDAGETVAHAGGPRRKEAIQAAQDLINSEEGKANGWHKVGEFSQSQDPAGIKKAWGGDDVKLVEDQELRGFKGDVIPQTKDEIFKDYENATRRQMNYQANLTVGDGLAGHMSALLRDDPAAYRLAEARLRDYAGQQSGFSKWQNNIADKLLAPVVGNNSASRIVSLTNSGMMHFTLGAMKLAYPVVNAVQFVQSVNPEAAFLLGKAPPETHAPNYSIFAAGGTKGPVGSLGVLTPLKLMFSSMKDMANPPADLKAAFVRAANDRTIEARVAEEYVGASATKVSNLRAVLKGDESFTGWLTALSEFLPAETERLSRTHAFTVGYKIARDFLPAADGGQLNPDQIYSFAKQFTEKTMFLYGTADRPRVFTTPAGSALGLFKNWMFHYMASMGEYTKEGFVHGNFAPLLWQQAGTLALGGLSAAPLYGVANEFSKLWAQKTLMQQAYENFDESADGILYGLPGMLGLSLTSSVDTPALSNPVRDASSLFSIAAWGRMKSLGTATKAAFDNWETTGEHPALNADVRNDLIKAFAPTSIYRSISAFANPDSIVQAGTGYPIQNDPSLTNRLLYAAGFNPKEIQRGYDISNALYENHEALKAEEQKLGTAWATAEMEGNQNQMALIMRQGMTWGVDISKVIKNGMFEIEKHRKDIIERQLRPKDIGAWRKTMLGGADDN
jgi:hypothetical protein